ncbi:MAG: hypothetical protein LBP70_01595 [Mycoplasmataceae bacterium]|nr:hypothetical protein [Mycoplasmataceae bacterium]
MKQVKITKYNKDPKRAGDEIVVEIQPTRGPKVPEWFKPFGEAILQQGKRLDNIDARLDKLEKNDQIIFDILERNNLK